MGEQVTADFAAMAALNTHLDGAAVGISLIDAADPLIGSGAALTGSLTAQACAAGGPRVTEALRTFSRAVSAAADTVTTTADAYRRAEEAFETALRQIGGPR